MYEEPVGLQNEGRRLPRPVSSACSKSRFSGGYGVRRRDPLDAARITAGGPGSRRVRAVRGAPGVRAWVSHSFPQNGNFSLK